MAKKKTKKKSSRFNVSPGMQFLLIVLLLPVSVTIYFFVFLAWQDLKTLPIFESFANDSTIEQLQEDFDLKIPEEYIPIYIEAGEKYRVPWTLLAAHHRIETRFSTMSTLISPVGAEGHMQFMPCTFVGWKHPTCNGLGQGDISDSEKTNPAIIAKYGGYGIDANGDGIADPFHIEDAIHSAANYLSKSGASEGQLKKAIYHYNHSDQYVEDILYYYHQYESIKHDVENVIMANAKR